MDIRSRLQSLASRKRRQEQLLDDIRAGKYADVMPASALLQREEGEEKHPPSAPPAIEALADLRPLEGPHGRTLVREFTLRPGDALGPAYRIPDWPGVPFTAPFTTDTLHHLSRDFPRDGSLEIQPGDVAFIDTETTGLAGGTGTIPFLIGVGWWQPDPLAGWTFRLEQYLIDDFRHEPDQIERVIARLEGFKVLCTYNGRAFDVPLLRARATLHRIPPRRLAHRQLDLLAFTRRLWGKALESVSLKRVESLLLGIDRGPDLDGALIPSIFFHMARTGRADRMAAVLDHNAWDIVTLGTLLRLLGRVAADPLGCGVLRRWEEWAAAARWFESDRRPAEALAAWRRAVECCDRDAEEIALMERMARACKKARAWTEALDLWEGLARRSAIRHLEAWIELARYHERVTRDPAAALDVVVRCRRQLEIEVELLALRGGIDPDHDPASSALDQLDRRAARLSRRLQRHEQSPTPRRRPEKPDQPVV